MYFTLHILDKIINENEENITTVALVFFCRCQEIDVLESKLRIEVMNLSSIYSNVNWPNIYVNKLCQDSKFMSFNSLLNVRTKSLFPAFWFIFCFRCVSYCCCFHCFHNNQIKFWLIIWIKNKKTAKNQGF